MAISGNYQQTDINKYKTQFDGTAVGKNANTDLAKKYGAQINDFISSTFQRDQADAKAANSKPNNTLESYQAALQTNLKYAADIGTLHNLETQYATATDNPDQLQRLQNNADQTGLGTTNSLLQQVNAKNQDGSAMTDKDIAYTGIGSSDGKDSQVSALYNHDLKDPTTGQVKISAKDISGTQSYNHEGAIQGADQGVSGQNWSHIKDGQTATGGMYQSDKGADSLNKLQGGTQAFGALDPALRADAFVFYNTLSPAEQSKFNSPEIKNLLNAGNDLGGDKGTANYNDIYNHFGGSQSSVSAKS